MKKHIIHGVCFIVCYISSSICLALPFIVVPKLGTQLPTNINPGSFVTAYYTISNSTLSQRNNNTVKYLPPNVLQVTTDATYSNTCGASFNLAPKGQAGDSCTLQLTISGAVDANNPNPHNHLFICFPGGKTCAGTQYPLNVSQNITAMTPYVNWMKQLSGSGYRVVQGSILLMQNTDCQELISIFNSCFDQNPAAPYIIPQPPIENSYVNPYYAKQLTTITPTGVPTNMVYQLGDNDALVSIVSYPPLAAYLGYQSYVFTSAIANYPISEPLQVVSPDPSRYEIFGSVGNDVNSVIVQNQFGVPWGGSIIVYITTANQMLAKALVANATAKNLNPHSLFIEPVGSNVIIGNNSAADDLVTLIRYAVPKSSAAASAWMGALSSNILVYKVTNSNIGILRYGMNEYTARVGTTDERPLEASLEELAELLKIYLATKQGEAVDIKNNIPSSHDNNEGVPSEGFVGSVCIEKGTICDGDNQDTSTYAIRALDHLGETQTAFIAGINHNEVNNTYYISADISDASTSTGVASSSQTNPNATGFHSGVLTGSARAVLNSLGIPIPPNLEANLPFLYVTFIARNCNNPNISAAKTYCINLMGNSLIPEDASISITERSYIRPGTTTGGNVNIMIYPRIIAAASNFG